jgi:gamma-glutamyltranspeptidase/glutathione hydrolase
MPWDLADFSEFSVKIEEPLRTSYRGYDVYTQTFNSQGPVLLETLNMLEPMDLRAMGHNSADYLHTLTEALKLAYADRDTYYADPDFVAIPAQGLLSKAYARERAKRIDPARASKSFVAGDPLPYDTTVKSWPYWKADIADATSLKQDALSPEAELLRGIARDTTHIAVVDGDGNVFDSTPSGAWIPTGVVMGKTGITASVRGEAFRLDKSRAAQMRPRSRPRYTLAPTMVMKDGLVMGIGTPGGDNQAQTILQVLLNIVEFWPDWYPNLHAAFDRPRLQTLHLFGSPWPHTAGFNRLNLEAPIPDATVETLRTRGHDVSKVAPFSIASCATAAMIDPATGNRLAGADPRRDCYAMAY